MKYQNQNNVNTQNSWQLQEAKACFSEVVRRAKRRPQRVTVRGKDAVVVISVEEYEKHLPAARCGLDELMANSPLAEIDFSPTGIPMPIREVEL